MKTLYIDCFAGIAGDMFMGAMLDLGVPIGEFKNAMTGLRFHEFELDIKKTRKSGFAGTDAKVVVTYAHHHEHEKDEHEHIHAHHHEHRGLREIEQIIAASELSEKVKNRSLKAFRLLAEAEGAVHGIAPEEVHCCRPFGTYPFFLEYVADRHKNDLQVHEE